MIDVLPNLLTEHRQEIYLLFRRFKGCLLYTSDAADDN